MRHVLRPELVLAVTFVFVFTPHSACAWSNGGYSADPENPDYGTHDWIADMALTLQTEDVSYIETTYHTEYLLGTEAPDNPEFIGDSTNHHVYYYASGTLQDDASANRASAMYGLALERLEAGNFSAAAYYIGAMTHYIADVGVFGHTMGAYTDWGTEVHHPDYEGEFETMLDTLTLPSDIALGNLSAYDATLGLARDITFGEGEIQTNVWMDTNYDWSDAVFRDSAMASLQWAVAAVAAAVNHLIVEAAYDPPFEPDPTVPTPPESLEAYLDEGRVTVTWSAPTSNGGEPIIEYQIFRGTDTSDLVLIGTASNLAMSWTDSDAEEEGNYTYWIAARNSVGLSEYSNAVTVTVPSDEGSSLMVPAIVSAFIAALASGGAIVWRMSRRRDVD